jgi:aryl-alcohol dehydrogenase-like predicted oxidoreductase
MLKRSYRKIQCRRAGQSGLWLSEIGLGLWKWGDPSYDGSRVGDHDGFPILDRSLEHGIFHWDTACSYNMGSGNSERLLGRYFASRGREVRDQVVLATKVSNPVRPEHVAEADFTPNQSGASRIYVQFAVEQCLRRLQTDVIDLLYIHSPRVDDTGEFIVPLDETWGAMDDLVTQGKVRYIAVSNHSARQMQSVASTVTEVGKDSSRRIVAVQNRYNLLQRNRVASEPEGSERAFLDVARSLGVSVIPYYPLASGLLTGRYRKDTLNKASGRIIDDGAQDAWFTDENLNAVEALIGLAEQKGLSLAQLALGWLLSREEVASVIAGVTRIEQLDDNVGAAELDPDDLGRIDAILEAAGLSNA